MNVEHRTSNIEHRMMYSVYLKMAQKTASLIKDKKLMNVEHRTPNIEHRIRYSVYSKRLSEAIPSFDIRHSTFKNSFTPEN